MNISRRNTTIGIALAAYAMGILTIVLPPIASQRVAENLSTVLSDCAIKIGDGVNGVTVSGGGESIGHHSYGVCLSGASRNITISDNHFMDN